MYLPHAALLASEPALIAMAELRITVTIVRMPLPILLPQQLFSHTLTLEFKMNGGEVGFSKTPLTGKRLCRE